MFKKLLDTDYYNEISTLASKIIKQDRDKYLPIFDLIREIIKKDRRVIISDTSVLINQSFCDNTLDIYSTHPQKTATTIANSIHKRIDKFVSLREILPDNEYGIMYNMRLIIKIYKLEKYKKITIIELVNPIIYKDLKYFDSNIELIDIYHKLYLPNYYDDWCNLLKIEKKLFTDFLFINKKNIENKKELKKQQLEDACVDCKIYRKNNIENIRSLLLKFLNNERYVLIGKASVDIISGKTVDLSNRLQILSENSIDRDYSNIYAFLETYSKLKIFYKKKKMFIPKDTRIYKYTIYIKYPGIKNSIGSDKPLVDIYSCAQYELIPYISAKYDDSNINIGNIYVIKRFMFIDLWIVCLLHKLESVTTSKFNIISSDIYKYISIIGTLSNKLDKSINYIGVNLDPKIEQSIEISMSRVKKSNYYPELSLNKNNKYKLLAST